MIGALEELPQTERAKKSSRNHGSQGGGGLASFPGAIGRLTTGASVRRLLTGFHAGSEAFAGVPADECFYGPQRHAEACSRCGLAHVVSFFSGRLDGKRTFRLPCLTAPQPGFPSTRREDMERRIPGQERFPRRKIVCVHVSECGAEWGGNCFQRVASSGFNPITRMPPTMVYRFPQDLAAPSPGPSRRQHRLASRTSSRSAPRWPPPTWLRQPESPCPVGPLRLSQDMEQLLAGARGSPTPQTSHQVGIES